MPKDTVDTIVTYGQSSATKENNCVWSANVMRNCRHWGGGGGGGSLAPRTARLTRVIKFYTMFPLLHPVSRFPELSLEKFTGVR
jgi:hypothetical protein